MPFDATTTVKAKLTLREQAEALGLKPIDRAFLEQFKARKLRNYRRLFYAARQGFFVTALVLLAGMFTGSVMTNVPVFLGCIIALVLVAIAALFAAVETPQHPSLVSWQETHWRTVPIVAVPIPTAIKAAATKLSRAVVFHDYMTWSYGYFYTDPYLILRDWGTHEEVIVGIWDGKKVIACA